MCLTTDNSDIRFYTCIYFYEYTYSDSQFIYTGFSRSAAAFRAQVFIDPACRRVSDLHTFIMALILEKGGTTLSLVSALGCVLVFKSRFDLAGYIESDESYLDLHNQNGNIVLRITFRKRQQKIFFNDRAYKSLRDGLGKEPSTDSGSLYVDQLKDSGVTITVHNCGPNRYQIFWHREDGRVSLDGRD